MRCRFRCRALGSTGQATLDATAISPRRPKCPAPTPGLIFVQPVSGFQVDLVHAMAELAVVVLHGINHLNATIYRQTGSSYSR